MNEYYTFDRLVQTIQIEVFNFNKSLLITMRFSQPNWQWMLIKGLKKELYND